MLRDSSVHTSNTFWRVHDHDPRDPSDVTDTLVRCVVVPAKPKPTQPPRTEQTVTLVSVDDDDEPTPPRIRLTRKRVVDLDDLHTTVSELLVEHFETRAVDLWTRRRHPRQSSSFALRNVLLTCNPQYRSDLRRRIVAVPTTSVVSRLFPLARTRHRCARVIQRAALRALYDPAYRVARKRLHALFRDLN